MFPMPTADPMQATINPSLVRNSSLPFSFPLDIVSFSNRFVLFYQICVHMAILIKKIPVQMPVLLYKDFYLFHSMLCKISGSCPGILPRLAAIGVTFYGQLDLSFTSL